MVQDQVAAARQVHAPVRQGRDGVGQAIGREHVVRPRIQGQLPSPPGRQPVEERLDPLIRLGAVQDNTIHVLIQVIADHADGQIQFPVQERRGLRPLRLRPDDMPLGQQACDIRLDDLRRDPFGGRAHDEAHLAGTEALRDGVQPVPFRAVVDPARHADRAGLGKEHDITAREGDFPARRRPFRAAGILRDLHHDGHAFRQIAALTEVQKGVLLQADIHKSRLDARDYIAHAAQEDASHEVGGHGPFHEIFLQDAVFHETHADLFRCAAHNDFLRHLRPLLSVLTL